MKKTHKKFIKEVFNLVGDEYEVLDEYISNGTPILMKHNKCGHIWRVKPNNFIYNKTRCPLCYSSKGEKIIREFLIQNKIKFEEQKRFADCRGKKYPLKFDFYLPEENCCIEFDGLQHFEPKGFGSKNKMKTLEGFINILINDKTKEDYCQNKNIKLIRIPYFETSQICDMLSILKNSK